MYELFVSPLGTTPSGPKAIAGWGALVMSVMTDRCLRPVMPSMCCTCAGERCANCWNSCLRAGNPA